MADTDRDKSPTPDPGSLSTDETLGATPGRSGPAPPPGRLSIGDALDHYVILGRIGAGGFGEVYRARDATLGRDVAIKVLPADVAPDGERIRRFEQEARAASALNHPNIVTVHGVGARGSISYLAMELVEGRTLREILGGSALPARRVLDIGAQIADGLAKAHEAGIVHRDLKPENVMVTKDGLAKILDFGLAKLAPAAFGSDGAKTGTGVVLGTVAYMSPEQAAGRAVDFHSDQFSLGSVLYEMAAGRRPFTAPTTAQTLATIIQDEPEALHKLNPRIPAPLGWIVERCLSKEPDRRYAATRDLARDLAALRDHLSEASGTTQSAAPVSPRRRRALLAAAFAFLGSIAAAVLVTRKLAAPPAPTFQRLTFRRGGVGNARFAPDGRTIVYDAAFEGRPSEIFTVRPESPESRSLGLPPGSEFLSVSSAGEIVFFQGGTVWRVPLGGGAPKAWLTDVTMADWAPDGKELAAVTHDGTVVELPPGTRLWESKRAVQALRVSPSGRHIALAETNGGYGDTTFIVLDRSGRQVAATKKWRFGVGLAWRSVHELWLGASEAGFANSLWAMDLSGRVRPIARMPGAVDVADVAPDRRALVIRGSATSQIAGLFPGDGHERDLTWLDFSYLNDISSDGRMILFSEFGDASGTHGAVYIRKTDGSPAVRLGDGSGVNLSPDGKWALATQDFEGKTLVALPTGPGEPAFVSLGALQDVSTKRASWFPDGSRFVVTGAEKGRKARCWAVEVSTGAVRPLTPEGIHGPWGHSAISPDGRSLLVRDARDEKVKDPPTGLFVPDTGRFEPLRGWKDVPLHQAKIRFSADGRALLGPVHEGGVATLNMPTPRRTLLVRFDLAKGTWEMLREIVIADAAGIWGDAEPVPAADGVHYAYFYRRVLTDLYLATGLR